MSLFTAHDLYQDYKDGFHRSTDALDALKCNLANEATIKEAERIRDFYEALANIWGRLYQYSLPKDEGNSYDARGH